jgi:hypothetical protein
VWGGNWFGDRRIVSAYTKKRAIELLGVSAYTFNKYGSQTGNVVELTQARAFPERVFLVADEFSIKRRGAERFTDVTERGY